MCDIVAGPILGQVASGQESACRTGPRGAVAVEMPMRLVAGLSAFRSTDRPGTVRV